MRLLIVGSFYVLYWVEKGEEVSHLYKMNQKLQSNLFFSLKEVLKEQVPQYRLQRLDQETASYHSQMRIDPQ